MDRVRSPVPIRGSIVTAKITPQRLQAMAWAGILISEAPKYAKEEKLRAVGERFRHRTLV
ncbi:hypothetical protein [Arthrobacter zhaoguopingii]|uniref:hypothetical protein n=1 Tax=Arthrobacter zhaoguopingii TaxID=2681491 RepID=UPI00135ACB3A|nr:hypothetical protein [Arthrobacter zhaoguopingii]